MLETTTRPPAVAGTFYPGDPEALRREVRAEVTEQARGAMTECQRHGEADFSRAWCVCSFCFGIGWRVVARCTAKGKLRACGLRMSTATKGLNG